MSRRGITTCAALLLAACVPVAPAHAATGFISTIAGTGTGGFSGDGGAATSAQLSGPEAVRPLPGGGYLINDQSNHRIRKIDANGVITTVAGSAAHGFSGDGGAATAAKLDTPEDAVPLPGGGFLISDSNNHRIRKVDANGVITTVVGTGTSGAGGDNGPAINAQLIFPDGLAVRSDGSFLIADYGAHEIRNVSASGVITRVAGTGATGNSGDGGPATSATLREPRNIALTSDGGFLIVDRGNSSVRKVSDTGTITLVAGGGHDPSGEAGDGGPAVDATLDTPIGLAVMPDGGYILSEASAEKVRRVTPDGIIHLLAGGGGCGIGTGCGDGGPATNADISAFGIGVNAEGDVLISDYFHSRVRLIDIADPPAPPPPPPPDPGPSPDPTPTPDPGTGGTTPTPTPTGAPPAIIKLIAGGKVLANQPATVSVTSSQPINRVDWDFDGDGKPEASCPGDEPDIRFRAGSAGGVSKADLSNKSVFATVNGPLGTSPPVSLPVPPQPSGTRPPLDQQVVTQVVARTPTYVCLDAQKAYAVKFEGPIGNILTAAKCLSATIYSGPLVIQGCMHPITNENDVPAGERAQFLDILRQHGVAPGQIPLTDGFIAQSSIRVNGVVIAPASASAQILIHPQIQSIVSTNASVKVGGIQLGARADFRLDTKAVGNAIPLGSFPALGNLPRLGFLDMFPGDVDVKIVGDDPATAHAEITLKLKLPAWLGGGPAVAMVNLKRDGTFDLTSLHIGPLSYDLGIVSLKDLRLDYADDTWRGGMQMCIAKEGCIDARPNKGGIILYPDGGFDAGATYVAPPPGITIATGVFLNEIGVSIADPPFRVRGTTRLTAFDFYGAQGKLVVAFPSAAAPYTLQMDRAGGTWPGWGNSFPESEYNVPRRMLTVAASGDLYAQVPVINKRIRLGGGYFLFDAKGYVAFGGGFDEDFKIIRVYGGINGNINFTNGRFNLHGEGKSCLADIPLLGALCWGSVYHLSDVGVGGCVQLGLVSVGGGVHFDSGDIDLWPIDGCKWSPFRDNNVQKVRAAQASGEYSVPTRAGDPAQVVEFRGAEGAAPKVHVVTADGKALDSTDASGFANANGIRILRSEKLGLTVVGIVKPADGVNRISMLPGSPPLTRVRTAEDQPKAQVSAMVSGSGARRTLRYDVGKRLGQKVTFYDVIGNSRLAIGTTTGGSGTLSFAPAPGNGKHKIEADFELTGIPAEVLTVATFSPPAPVLARPARLRASHSKTTVRLSWRAVPEATSYTAVVTLSSGVQKTLHFRRAGGILKGVPRWASGRVAVTALADGRQSRTASARFRGVGKHPTGRFVALPRVRK